MGLNQIASLINSPFTILVIFAILVAAARPDRDPEGEGLYAVYLAGASIASLYIGLVAAASLGQAITRFQVGNTPGNQTLNSTAPYGYFFDDASASTIAAYGTVVVIAAIVFGFHAQRRRELGQGDRPPDDVVERVERAYLAGVCFAMVSLALTAAIGAGSSAVTFFSPPNHGDYARDLAGGTLLSDGGLVLVAFLIFRSRFWAIRRGQLEHDGEEPDLPLADLDAS